MDLSIFHSSPVQTFAHKGHENHSSYGCFMRFQISPSKVNQQHRAEPVPSIPFEYRNRTRCLSRFGYGLNGSHDCLQPLVLQHRAWVTALALMLLPVQLQLCCELETEAAFYTFFLPQSYPGRYPLRTSFRNTSIVLYYRAKTRSHLTVSFAGLLR